MKKKLCNRRDYLELLPPTYRERDDESEASLEQLLEQLRDDLDKLESDYEQLCKWWKDKRKKKAKEK